MRQDSNETDNDAGASHILRIYTIHVHNDLLELALTIVLQNLLKIKCAVTFLSVEMPM